MSTLKLKQSAARLPLLPDFSVIVSTLKVARVSRSVEALKGLFFETAVDDPLWLAECP